MYRPSSEGNFVCHVIFDDLVTLGSADEVSAVVIGCSKLDYQALAFGSAAGTVLLETSLLSLRVRFRGNTVLRAPAI